LCGTLWYVHIDDKRMMAGPAPFTAGPI
jgi:hypothetical protein